MHIFHCYRIINMNVLILLAYPLKFARHPVLAAKASYVVVILTTY